MAISLKNAALIQSISAVVDTAAAWFVCCAIGVFIMPLLLDRLFFYLPRLYRLAKNKEVQGNSVPRTIVEILLWVVILCVIYIGMYFLKKSLFDAITSSIPALTAWGISAVYLIYRVVHFDQMGKREFYYNAYMRYITPEALAEYQHFIEDIDLLYIDDLDALLTRDLPYMHRQAVLRKRRQANDERASEALTKGSDSGEKNRGKSPS